MKKVNSFIKQFIATVQGDSATVLAEKNYRRATSAIKAQIAVAEAELVNLEEKVSNAQEALMSSYVNEGKEITSGEIYVQNLINKNNDVTVTENSLKKHQAKMEFLNKTLNLLNEETEIEEVQ